MTDSNQPLRVDVNDKLIHILDSEEMIWMHEGLSALKGKPLWDMFRYAGWQAFCLGAPTVVLSETDDKDLSSELMLSVCCEWQITGPDGFLLGSQHFGTDRKRMDSHANSFYEELDREPPLVISTAGDHTGGFEVTFTRGYTLVVQPGAAEDPPEDQWCLLFSKSNGGKSLWLTSEEVYWI